MHVHEPLLFCTSTRTMDSPESTFAWTNSFLSARNVLGLIGVWLAFKLLQALYNISPFHPLSHIPGPKLAAASYLPEFYYDVVKFGCYTKEIRKLHEIYGKSVIGPVPSTWADCAISRSHSTHQSKRSALQRYQLCRRNLRRWWEEAR